MSSNSENSPPGPGQIQLIALAIGMNPVIYGIICFLMKQFVLEEGKGFVFENGEEGTLLFTAAMVVTFAGILGAIFLRKQLRRFTPENDPAAKMREILICMMAAQAGSVAGLMYFLMYGKLMEGLMLMGIGFAASIYFFPLRISQDNDGK